LCFLWVYTTAQMSSEHDAHSSPSTVPDEKHPGERIRAARRRQKLSVRELARRAELTPSHVSKIERGLTNPSVGSLWKISDVLGLTVSQLFPAPPAAEATRVAKDTAAEEGKGLRTETETALIRSPAGGVSPVVDPAHRDVIRMMGVEFQRLTPADDDIIEFIEVRHEVGAGDDEAYHHRGREYGLVLTGRLRVDVGFKQYFLEPGFSIAFDSSLPHRVVNVGDEPANAIWLTIGRSHPHP
jgi:transcriptional regulator with XRE-family HTH domain